MEIRVIQGLQGAAWRNGRLRKSEIASILSWLCHSGVITLEEVKELTVFRAELQNDIALRRRKVGETSPPCPRYNACPRFSCDSDSSLKVQSTCKCHFSISVDPKPRICLGKRKHQVTRFNLERRLKSFPVFLENWTLVNCTNKGLCCLELAIGTLMVTNG